MKDGKPKIQRLKEIPTSLVQNQWNYFTYKSQISPGQSVALKQKYLIEPKETESNWYSEISADCMARRP